MQSKERETSLYETRSRRERDGVVVVVVVWLQVLVGGVVGVRLRPFICIKAAM